MPNPLRVLVTGATGAQGGAVARHLLARGHHVRAVTRTPSSPAAAALRALGAEVAGAAFDDPATLRRAATGMDAAFVMATPYEAGVEAEVRHGTAMFEAARAAGVAHVVYSSVANADRQTGVPHFESKAELERRLAATGVRHTVVAPAYFMENVLAPWSLPALRAGTLAVALPAGRPLAQVPVDTIGAFAAAVLDAPERFAGARIDLASDEVSGADRADALARATGRPVAYLELPLAELAAHDEDTARMFAWLDAEGYDVDVAGLRREHPGVPWPAFGDWAARQDWSALLAEAA